MVAAEGAMAAGAVGGGKGIIEEGAADGGVAGGEGDLTASSTIGVTFPLALLMLRVPRARRFSPCERAGCALSPKWA